MIKKRNDALDAMKAFAALLVIFLHFLSEKNWSTAGYLRALARIAVPYFFCVSGYFYGAKAEEKSRDYALRQCKKLVKLLFLLYAVTILEDLVMMLYRGSGIAYLKKEWAPILTWRFLLLNFRFTGSGWFLRALIYVLLIYALFLRKVFVKHEKGFMMFTGMLTVLFPFCCKYLNVISSGVVPRWIYEYSSKYIGVAFCFFTIGMFLARHPRFQELSSGTKKILGAGICLAGIFNCAERYFLLRFYRDAPACDYIATPVLTLLIFVFLLNVHSYRGRILPDIGRRDSTYIYIFHLPIGHFLRIGLKLIGVTVHPLVLCLMIYVLALAVSRVYQAAIFRVVKQ